MLIELIGPAGSGKSTVARTLIPELRAQGHEVWDFETLEKFETEQGERHILRLGRCRRWSRMAGASFDTRALHGPSSVCRFFTARHFAVGPVRPNVGVADFLGALVLTQNVASPEIVIIHDGFLQKLWSLVIESRRLRGASLIRRALASYYNTIEQRGIVLLVDDATSEARVFARTSKGRFNQDTPPEKRAHFGRWLDYHRRLINALPDHVLVGQVPAEGTPDDVAQSLGRIIDDLTSESPRLEDLS